MFGYMSNIHVQDRAQGSRNRSDTPLYLVYNLVSEGEPQGPLRTLFLVLLFWQFFDFPFSTTKCTYYEDSCHS